MLRLFRPMVTSAALLLSLAGGLRLGAALVGPAAEFCPAQAVAWAVQGRGGVSSATAVVAVRAAGFALVTDQSAGPALPRGAPPGASVIRRGSACGARAP